MASDLSSSNIAEQALEIYDHLFCSRNKVEYLNLTGKKYIPGTVTISERFNHFSQYSDVENFRVWIKVLITDFINSISAVSDFSFHHDQVNSISEKAIEILTFNLPGQRSSIIDKTTIQQTTDIINRTVKSIIFSNQFYKIHINRDFNKLGKEIAFDIIENMIDMDLKNQIKFSVISGTIGYEIKNSYKSSIPSALITDRVIKIYDGKKRIPNNTIAQKILDKLNENFVIDHIDQLLFDISQKDSKLVFFTDDYIESIFDMVIISNLLKQNPSLGITLIPRNGHYANDFSYEDAKDIMKCEIFRYLKSNKGRRFNILKTGPKGSGISITEFSDEVLNTIHSSSVILFKGARVFEMVHGINKKSYFAFNIIHEQSSLLTGIPATQAPSIFVKQEPSELLFTFKDQEHIVNTIEIIEHADN